jgi:hypothetical protein
MNSLIFTNPPKIPNPPAPKVNIEVQRAHFLDVENGIRLSKSRSNSPKAGITVGIRPIVEQGFEYVNFSIDNPKSNTLICTLSKNSLNNTCNKKLSQKNQNETGGYDLSLTNEIVENFNFTHGQDWFFIPFGDESDTEKRLFKLYLVHPLAGIARMRIQINEQNVEDRFKNSLTNETYENEKKKYRKEVDKITLYYKTNYIDLIENYEQYQPNIGMTCDHIFSVHYGFEFGIPAEIIAHPSNLRFIKGPGQDGNFSKGKKTGKSGLNLIYDYCNATNKNFQDICNQIKFVELMDYDRNVV